MRLLTLNEYRTTCDVELSSDELHAIQAATNSIGITPSQRVDGCYDLTPGSYVGGIQLQILAIEILPKLPIERLLFLISYTIDRLSWRDTDFNFMERSSLLEAVIPGFVSQVRRAFHRGVLQGYRSQEDSLQTVRGRIRFDDQIRNRYGIVPPVEVRYDEFTDDIEENRLIKAAIHRLGRMRIRSDRARQSLRAFDSLLANVQPVEYHPRQLPTINYTRLNSHYRSAIELAKLILRATTFEVEHGAVRTSSFLMDMNQIFEDFVAIALRESLHLSDTTFSQGATGKGLVLDHGRRVRLRPDLSWWEAGACVFAGDVKYKNVNPNGVIHPDLYQLLAYTIAADLPGGLLIYAAGETDDATHRIVHAGKTLRVVTLDLEGSPDDILGQIDGVADEVRQLRPRSWLEMAAD
jgi:5-methylcytosine-specific restriction enzyme subunit McrC